MLGERIEQQVPMIYHGGVPVPGLRYQRNLKVYLDGIVPHALVRFCISVIDVSAGFEYRFTST